jgi:hypothetical protein
MTARGDPGPAAQARRAAPFLLWGLAGAAACLGVAGLEPNLVEEGLVVHFAERLAGGEHLYRDLVFFTGPLPFELLAALFRVFGAEIAVGRAAQALAHAAATAATFGVARRAGAGPLAHLAAALVAAAPILLFPLFSIFYYTPLAFGLGSLAVAAAVRGAGSRGFAAGAGLLVAAVALCKQTIGAVAAAGLLACLAAGAPAPARRARAGAMLSGGAAAALATLAFYAARGDLADLVRCLVAVPIALGDRFGSGYPNLWPPGRLAPELEAHKAIYFPNLWLLRHGLYAHLGFGIVLATQALYALPFLALAATALSRIAGPLALAVWCHAAWLLAITTNLFPRADWGHLVYALPSACVQLVLLAGAGARAARIPTRALGALAAAGTLGLATAALGTARWLHAESGEPRWGPRVPLRPVSAVYRIPTVPRVIHFLRERLRPDEPIFVARAEPLLYFATGARNPTPYGGVLPVLNAEQEERILGALPGLRYVVMSDVDQPSWTYYAEELPRVQEHLERYYRIPRYFPLDDASWLVVLERGPDRGATAIDLVVERPLARAFVRDAPDAERAEEHPPPRLVARHNKRPLGMRVGRFGGGLDYEIRVPERARFEAGVGFRGMVSLEDLHEHPKRSRMRVSVRRPGGEPVELAAVRVDDSRGGGRRWTAIEADLSAFGGELVTLRLELVPEAPLLPPAELGWWGSPRIFVPPAAAGPEGEAD